MKRFIFLFLALFCAVLAVACTQDNTNNNDNENENVSTDISADEIYTKTQELEAFGEMQNYQSGGEILDADTASFFFGTLTEEPDMTIVKDYVLSAAVGFSADEFGIFIVNDSDDVDTVKAYFNTRIENLKAKFKDYSAEEYEKASSAIVESRGCYVWYIISSSANKVNQAVLSAVNG